MAAVSESNLPIMPFYTVQHSITLSEGQQDKLAQAITEAHSSKFITPQIFVNVHFQDVSKDIRYVAGKRRAINLVQANVRHGPSRTAEHYNDLMQQIEDAWTTIVPNVKLNGIVLNGSIVAGMEQGLVMPAAGEDKQWLAENWKVLNERASAGDKDMQAVIADIKGRGLVG